MGRVVQHGADDRQMHLGALSRAALWIGSEAAAGNGEYEVLCKKFYRQAENREGNLMKERLQSSWLFYWLAVVWGAYPIVFLLGNHFVEGSGSSRC